MKIEKWTIRLAAVGLATFAPALFAQDASSKLVPVQTALSATTISGYVDTSAVWNPGTGNANPAPYAFNKGKQDGFNLDAVDLKVARALDETAWAAGYVLELSAGPDAIAIDGAAYPLRQAYVALNTPVGNGLNWEIGRWDSLLGYESSDSYLNPNFTRSYGKTFEPTENTGILASYKANDVLKLQVGVANTVNTVGATGKAALNGVNARVITAGASAIESKKAFTSLVTLTAPDSFGGFKGSTLVAGWDYGQGAATHDTSEIYVGTTVMTPVKDLTFGATWDAVFHTDVGGQDADYFQAIAGYASYKLTDKLTLSGRGEYADGTPLGAQADAVNSGGYVGGEPASPLHKVLAFTGTLQYDLWANVISRLEVRWDHAADATDSFGGGAYDGGVADKKNEVLVAANVIYKF